MIPLVMHQHHVMLTMVQVVSHDQRYPVAPHFNHVDLRNALIPLMMLSALCDVIDNGIT